MKKTIAFLLAVLLLVGMTACGNDADKSKEDTPSTTITTKPTAPVGSSDSVGDTDASSAPAQSDGTAAVNPTGAARPSGSTATPTTTYAPIGEIVPVGTQPTTSTTTTPSAGGSSTGSTAPTTQVEEPVGTTTTTTTSTTTTTTRPTEPPVQGLQIILPSIGSDIDATNKKNRIRVSAHAAWLNEDGTIGVQLTFKNYTSSWITEETDYIQYTCYDKNGKVVQRSTKLMIGVIDTKKHKEKTFTFNVPATTYEVRITKSKITYWTEWA